MSSFADQLKKYEKEIGYKGCKNCVNQIESLRMCEWAEQGGDGHIHLLCPRWEKKDGSNRTRNSTNIDYGFSNIFGLSN